MSVLLATNNSDKLREIKEIFKVNHIKILSYKDLKINLEIEEDQSTIEGNAIKKARDSAIVSGCLTLADDTGLFINELNNEPGVFSARYAGESCSYRDNRLKVLDLMKNKKNRFAYFKTVAALAAPETGKIIQVVFGVTEGEITYSEVGEKGFGYDSIFRVKDIKKTFAELSLQEKNRHSHRGKAFRNMIPFLKKALKQMEV